MKQLLVIASAASIIACGSSDKKSKKGASNTNPAPTGEVTESIDTFLESEERLEGVVKLQFGSNENGVSFVCKLDTKSVTGASTVDDWSDCNAGYEFKMTEGNSYTLQARAFDQARSLNDSTPFTKTYRLEDEVEDRRGDIDNGYVSQNDPCFEPGQNGKGKFEPGQNGKGKFEPGQNGKFEPGQNGKGKFDPGQNEDCFEPGQNGKGKFEPGQNGKFEPGQNGKFEPGQNNGRGQGRQDLRVDCNNDGYYDVTYVDQCQQWLRDQQGSNRQGTGGVSRPGTRR